jgi:hypothetical protein
MIRQAGRIPLSTQRSWGGGEVGANTSPGADFDADHGPEGTLSAGVRTNS